MRVERIGFTPVKGGRHVAHESVVLDASGPVGDRAFCLVDRARGRVLRTVENPSLVRTVAHWHGGVLSVRLPFGIAEGAPIGSGDVVEVDYWGRVARLEVVDGPWAAAYSRFLGYAVVLARVAPGAVVYAGPVSLVTTEALRWLGRRAGTEVAAERFRSTFVVDSGAGERRTEDQWVGRRVGIGEAEVEVTATIPRCAVVDLDPLTGVRDRALLKAIGGPDLPFGVDAVVTRPGRVRVGDRVLP
ncbi:MOSC domain-containing protein [Nocardioides marmoribigeumensis]|uniref:Uncharacterized protein YcbX n=1 Tax=Nocardioides marmoribigeumensis TaxID=433649 RepID=A0ABU2BRT1_9ACTN|nr:MOSC domain-containing protein [Nocardioides marmoribigeumensis]MDR7361355.1 uncharacterized protein YcbX [Nocardioides marmoribigeumensis]